MERGKEHEVVFEYTPEPLTNQRTPVVGVKGGTTASRVAVSSAVPSVENENIDSSALNARNAMNMFFKKEAYAAAFEKEAAKTEAQRQRQAAQEAVVLPPSLTEKAETRDQRCARLQVECLELLRCCESSSMGDLAARTELMGSDPKEIADELRALEKLLRVWRKGATASSTTAVYGSGVGGPGAMSDSLAIQLDRLATAPGGDLAAKGSGEEGMVTWEVNFAPSTIPIIQSSQIAALESSLAEMEKKIGVTGAKDQDIYHTMTTLHRRMGLLDPQKLESIRTSAGKAKSGFEIAMSSKHLIRGRDGKVDQKVKELYDSCHRWTPVAANLPAVVTRMQSLEALHQMSASFTSRLSALEHEQEELVKILEVTNMAVQEMSKGMQDNMGILTQNMDALEQKIAKQKKGWFG